MNPLRPLGYFLWALLWLLLGGVIVAVPPLLLDGVLRGVVRPDGAGPITVLGVLVWVFGVPLCAWLFVVFPLTLLGQAAIAFVASGMSLREEYRERQIVEFVGSSRSRHMVARIDTPALRLLTAISDVGTIPGWVFAISAMVGTAGFGVLLTVPAPVGGVAAAALVTVAAGGSVIGIRSRINELLAKPAPTATDKYGLTEKYYKGLRYREGKRARDLQKARDAGKAPTTGIAAADTSAFDRWAAAEAEHALRIDGRAAYNARKGVPGALDEAIDAVFAAMEGRVTREQAQQLVVTAAAFRGKKPVLVPKSASLPS